MGGCEALAFVLREPHGLRETGLKLETVLERARAAIIHVVVVSSMGLAVQSSTWEL
jgi:hypothetical protein